MSKTKTPIKNTSVPSAYDTPLTTLEYLRKVQEQNAQVLARQDEIEEALNGKVAKSGDTMTGDLSVSNINVNNNANVGKLNSEKLNQKYEGAIKAELHVDEEGITEFVNGSNAGRFDTARVIKPSEVKTEIYDNQQGKRMFFRLPYLEASAGDHRLLTEEDLGGGGNVDIDGYTATFSPQTGDYNFYINFRIKTINSDVAFFEINGSVSGTQAIPALNELFIAELPDTLANKISTMIGFRTDILLSGIVISAVSTGNYTTNSLRLFIPANGKRLSVRGPISQIRPDGSNANNFNFTGMVVAKHE